jgi:TolB-like protein
MATMESPENPDLADSSQISRVARSESLKIDLQTGELQVEGRKVPLQHQPFQILSALIENPGAVITRDQIRDKLWPGDTTIDFDHGIDTAIKKLRRALADDVSKPRYIDTLPRRGYRWLPEVQWEPPVRSIATELRQSHEEHTIDSIAVLPFSNLNPEPDSNYFSEGLAEEILNALTKVPGLRVTARTSAFALRLRNGDIRDIAAALDVRAILQGSVRRAGNRLRVTVQLVGTADGYHLWSERYDCELTDVFTVQEQISEAIAKRLNPSALTIKHAVPRTANIDSYDAFLRGRHIFSKLTPETVKRSRAYFEEAIALDPEYGPAYSGLARCLFFFAQFDMEPPGHMMAQARKQALRAVALNPLDSEAQALLGQVAGAFDFDWDEALRRYRLALACAPPTHLALHWCAQFILIPLRRFDEAIALLEPLLIADPFALFPRKTLADALVLRGDQDRGFAEFRRVTELDDDFWLAHGGLGWIYSLQNKLPEAINAYEKVVRTVPVPFLMARLAALYARTGDGARSQAVLARLDPSHNRGSYAKAMMFYHFEFSEYDSCADYLEELMRARDPDVVFICFMPELSSKSPRLRKLVETIFPITTWPLDGSCD